MSSDQMHNDILQVRNLCVDAVPRKGKPFAIVNDISFSVEPGKVVALIGESGSGKTTISLACMAYAKPGCVITSGSVELDGMKMLELNQSEKQLARGVNISYVAQSAAASFNSALTINRQVTEIPVIKNLMSREEAEKKAIELYRQLDLPDPENIGKRYPHQVSGGQLQRLMAAMAMICDPKLLILDEPTTALDVTTQIEVLQAFKNLIHQKNTSAIYVSHDLSVVAQIADDILVLKDGKMVEYGPVEQIVSNAKQDYTRMLIDAAHVMPDTIHPAPVNTKQETPMFEANNITAGYGINHASIVLKDVSLRVNKGETVGVIGESGSGKSTLGRVICGLMSPKIGDLILEGAAIPGALKQRSLEQLQRIQIVFQMADVALNPRHRIQKILQRPLEFYFGMSGQEAKNRVIELLELVELPASFMDRYPRELSGGQKQRVNLARALAAKPDLIICDEITSALDTIVAEAILDLLQDLQDRLGITYIFISHDISTIAKIADTVAVMRLGEVVEYGSTSEILTPPHHEYTELLLDSVPDLHPGWLEKVMAKRLESA